MNITYRLPIFIWAIAVLAASNSSHKATGQKVVVGQPVAAEHRVAMDSVDHSAWDGLLQKYVNQQGQVNYSGWKSSSQDVAALDRYLNTLASVSLSHPATRKGQLAYWINAYNAVTIKGILREYPTTSIRNHTAKLAGYNIWKDLLLTVGDRQVSLHTMEHDVLRKMGEPRIHFAIVCASHSCPRLLNRAYTADRLHDQLTENTKEFFANPENFQYDPQGGRFHVSSIMKWFGKDFGKGRAEQLRAIAPYLPSKAAYRAAMNNSVRVSWLDYDWSLNEWRVSRQPESGSGRR